MNPERFQPNPLDQIPNEAKPVQEIPSGTNQTKFNPEKKFLEHSDESHEESIERKKFDFEYQREFRDFFLNALKEANVDISDSLKSHFEVPADEQDVEKKIASGYLSPTSYLSAGITPKYPEERLILDDQLREKFEESRRNLSQREMMQRTPGELNEQITKAYLEKVDLDKLFSLMEKETDQAKKNLLLLIIQIINQLVKRGTKVKVLNLYVSIFLE